MIDICPTRNDPEVILQNAQAAAVSFIPGPVERDALHNSEHRVLSEWNPSYMSDIRKGQRDACPLKFTDKSSRRTRARLDVSLPEDAFLFSSSLSRVSGMDGPPPADEDFEYLPIEQRLGHKVSAQGSRDLNSFAD